jgi:uncharacterized membrane protein
MVTRQNAPDQLIKVEHSLATMQPQNNNVATVSPLEFAGENPIADKTEYDAIESNLKKSEIKEPVNSISNSKKVNERAKINTLIIKGIKNNEATISKYIPTDIKNNIPQDQESGGLKVVGWIVIIVGLIILLLRSIILGALLMLLGLVFVLAGRN